MAGYINLGLIIISILADADVARLTIIHGNEIASNDKKIATQQNLLQKDDIDLLKNYKNDVQNVKNKNYKPILSQTDVKRANKIIKTRIKDPQKKMSVKKDMDKYKKNFMSRLKKTKKIKYNTKKQTKKNK